jgi:hypothetical protein
MKLVRLNYVQSAESVTEYGFSPMHISHVKPNLVNPDETEIKLVDVALPLKVQGSCAEVMAKIEAALANS